MSYFSQFKHSIAPFRKVRHVQFGILSPDEIVRLPNLQIIFRGPYMTSNNVHVAVVLNIVRKYSEQCRYAKFGIQRR
jgi:hypothetical protein